MENVHTKLNIPHIRTKYRDKMLILSFIASQWSTQPDGQQHGAVLALDGKYVVSLGFNGPDRNWQSPAWSWRPQKEEGPKIIHAEINALINLGIIGVDASRCICFVSKKPCPPCMQALESAGIQAVFWMQDVGEDRGQWVRP